MNKKLLAVAIGSALAGAPMFANAAATLYGAVHLSIDAVDDGQATNSSLTTLSSNSSFIGIKADEDLGGGLKAIMGAEYQLAFDTGTTNMANRNVFVGLSGGFGTVKLGQIDDIVKQVGRKVDMNGNEQLGESRTLTSQNSQDARTANSINYISPKLGPVELTVNYGLANSANDLLAEDLTILAAGAQVNVGGLYVGAAWKTRDTDRGTTKSSIDSYRVTAMYTFGFGLTLAGFYQNVNGDESGAPAAGNTNLDYNTMGVGARFKIGNGAIKGQWYTVDEKATGLDNGATLTTVGYEHNLSKNTQAYVVYTKVDNDTNGTYSAMGGGGHANPADYAGYNAASNTDNGGASVGMKMKF